jgi:hypothetical protein
MDKIPVIQFPRYIFWDRKRNSAVNPELAMKRVIWYGDIDDIKKLHAMIGHKRFKDIFNGIIKPEFIKKDKYLIELMEILFKLN